MFNRLSIYQERQYIWLYIRPAALHIPIRCHKNDHCLSDQR